MISPANRAFPDAPVNTPADTTGDRGALHQSEKKAAEKQPDSFNEKALTDKVVEIPPVGPTEAPIKGLDPEPSAPAKPPAKPPAAPTR
jgi:hypothetical protein